MVYFIWLCYVNCFKNPESPILIRLQGGSGAAFKKDVRGMVETLRKEIPQIFESQEYVNMKKEIMETHEKKASSFFKTLDQKVKEQGFVVVDVQVGQFKRPAVMPVVDGIEAYLARNGIPRAADLVGALEIPQR